MQYASVIWNSGKWNSVKWNETRRIEAIFAFFASRGFVSVSWAFLLSYYIAVLSVWTAEPVPKPGKRSVLKRPNPSFSLPFSLFTPLPSQYRIKSPPFFLCPHLRLLPSEAGPLNTAMGLGKSCKLPQRGLGRSSSGIRICCILALKSDIWRQQFY